MSFNGGRLPVCDHDVLVTLFSGGTRPAQIGPVSRYEFPKVGIGTVVCCDEHQRCFGFLFASGISQ